MKPKYNQSNGLRHSIDDKARRSFLPREGEDFDPRFQTFVDEDRYPRFQLFFHLLGFVR